MRLLSRPTPSVVSSELTLLPLRSSSAGCSRDSELRGTSPSGESSETREVTTEGGSNEEGPISGEQPNSTPPDIEVDRLVGIYHGDLADAALEEH